MRSEEILPPIFAPEVWAFGVTYMDSMRERQAESGSPDVYALVYNADRPEAFFKSTAERLVSPGGALGIRELIRSGMFRSRSWRSFCMRARSWLTRLGTT